MAYSCGLKGAEYGKNDFSTRLKWLTRHLRYNSQNNWLFWDLSNPILSLDRDRGEHWRNSNRKHWDLSCNRKDSVAIKLDT